MAQIDLTFTNKLNTSIQAKPLLDSDNNPISGHDVVYFVKSGETDVRQIGKCIATNFTTNTVTVQVVGNIPTPQQNDFIFFGKDTEVGMSGLDGYFAKVEMKNTLTSEAELFAVGSDVVQSSK